MQTDGQVADIMPPAAHRMGGGKYKIYSQNVKCRSRETFQTLTWVHSKDFCTYRDALMMQYNAKISTNTRLMAIFQEYLGKQVPER